MTALATTPLTDAGLVWLRQYFIDTYNEDWATKYQLELVGEVPDDVLRWADVERRVVCASCGDVSDGQYSLHGGYGATNRTVQLVCGGCGWLVVREVSEVRPPR